MSDTASYPEHDKLRAVAGQTQAIGDFLEWIAGEHHAHLMVWREWDEPTNEECPTRHFTPRSLENCKTCHGTGRYDVVRHRAMWVSLDGGVQDWLAGWAGVDLKKLEQEKRAILAALRGEAA